MAKKKSKKYEYRMQQRQEANAEKAADARKKAEIAARPALLAQIKAEMIDLIKEVYGDDLQERYEDICWRRLDVQFLAGRETPLYRVDRAFPSGGDVLAEVTLKEAEFFPKDTVQIGFHEYRGEPAPVSACDGSFDKYLLHENCSGYYD